MRKIIIFLLVLLGFIIAFLALGKQKLASYFLSRQLSSDRIVNEIIAQQNQPVNPYNQAFFNDEPVNYINQKSSLLSQISQIENENESSNILGADSEKWIEVNLSQQKLYTWEGSNLTGSYLVSTGKWAPTPTGDYKIWIKLAKATMSGGSKALGTYYYLPNVPCTMYFYKGYGIHGTYWHNNFGHPMSHGCVNMRTEDACTVFAWASVGTRVNIHN